MRGERKGAGVGCEGSGMPGQRPSPLRRGGRRGNLVTYHREHGGRTRSKPLPRKTRPGHPENQTLKPGPLAAASAAAVLSKTGQTIPSRRRENVSDRGAMFAELEV